MKMKKACQATSLTERAIRLYIAKGLLAPGQTEGLLDFSHDDIQRLKDIAVLRRFDFTIEQIADMIKNPAMIPVLLRSCAEAAAEEREHARDVCDTLKRLEGQAFDDVSVLVAQIKAQHVHLSEPNFGHLDELSDAEREQGKKEAVIAISRHEEARKGLRRLLMLCGMVLAIFVGAAVYLSQERMTGFVALPPVTVAALHADKTMTVEWQDEELMDTVGSDKIRVSYHVFGTPVQVGETIENGCQLAVALTNGDLLRLGINPLHKMETHNAVVNNAYKTWALQAMCADGDAEAAVLYIREISNLRPLFQE